jgi:hypothetical protein
MARALVAALAIFAILVGWLWVQRTYARFAASHPELGPFRTPDGSCGGGCACKGGSCERP